MSCSFGLLFVSDVNRKILIAINIFLCIQLAKKCFFKELRKMLQQIFTLKIAEKSNSEAGIWKYKVSVLKYDPQRVKIYIFTSNNKKETDKSLNFFCKNNSQCYFFSAGLTWLLWNFLIFSFSLQRIKEIHMEGCKKHYQQYKTVGCKTPECKTMGVHVDFGILLNPWTLKIHSKN